MLEAGALMKSSPRKAISSLFMNPNFVAVSKYFLVLETIFDWSKCMITTLSPNKIDNKFYEMLISRK